ncbi:MAG: LLM class flavin-dependent oxidoreductase [Candidatus Caldarchaeum sp.]
MKLDITLGPFVNDPLRSVQLGVLAEKLGFNGVWITHDPLWENSWVVCGGLASNTERIEVGPGIVNPYSSTVVEIAMGSSTLQNMSRGRANLGVGPGSKKMLEESGLGHRDLLQTLDSTIDYLKRELNPETSTLRVKPVREVPVFVGCQSPRLLERIGRWKVGGLILLTPPGYAGVALKHISRGYGGPLDEQFRSKQIASILCAVDKDENEARKNFAKFIVHILKYLAPGQLEYLSIDRKTIAEAEKSYAEGGWEALPSRIYELGAVGVEDVIRKTEALEKVGFTRVKIGSPLGGDLEKALELLASDVLPHFR